MTGPAAVLDRLNARHPWSHNDHFHGWVLRHLPERRGSALDVGCGRGGLLARLAGAFDHVSGIDVDAEMVAAARVRVPRADVRRESLLDARGRHDLVTVVATLHHVPLEDGLRAARDLVAPGGRLLVIGLARTASPTDLGVDLASSALNPLVGLAKHPRVERGGPRPADVPVKDAHESYAEVRAAATRLLPGSRFRHRMWFRYTLAWER
ncbi:class I SAM-dependent methyltransferase [Nocardioides anomalus]|uniref:Class I SAM-dependent methyltransferase n=1 Tax=Nocardioides anomalus TaxID=2712223 RepID=A0A6G6WK24_9ACTN|nr:class I SAM-dependent methyltransferase [Nocardioides anomalus]QIG45420.1 class I SAM-dependent methyltransferase [Nocardioides anomalus]